MDAVDEHIAAMKAEQKGVKSPAPATHATPHG